MKKAQFNFSVLFAILVGAVILFLAIYGATKVGETQRYQTDTEIAKKLTILTDPLQAGFASGKVGKIEFQQTTKISNECYTKDEVGDFGENRISIQTSSGIGEKWQPSGAKISVNNKYIFSSDKEGENFYIFSKGFEFPYKISDLTMLISERYCFVNPNEEIKEDLSLMNVALFDIVNSTGLCEENSNIVCFDSSCKGDIFVKEGFVEKEGEKLYFIGNLIYPAILSDKGIYDCNVERLFERGSKLADIYSGNLDLMSLSDCSSDVSKQELETFGNLLENSNLNDLDLLREYSEDLEDKNNEGLCDLW